MGCKKKENPSLVGRWQLTGYEQTTYWGYDVSRRPVDTIIYTLNNHTLLLYDRGKPKINKGTIWMQLNIAASDSITINQVSSEPGYNPQSATYKGSYTLSENSSGKKIDFQNLWGSFLFFGNTPFFNIYPFTYTVETLTDDKLALRFYQNSPEGPDYIAENNCRFTFTRY